VLSSPSTLQEIVQLAPEWESTLRSMAGEGRLSVQDFFVRVGPQTIYRKALGLNEERGRFLVLIRDGYFQPQLNKMLNANQNLRRFWSQRHMDAAQQKEHVLSFSVDLAQKMEGVLIKHLNQVTDDGYKVLLPAYIQRSVHNAIVDYIRQEWTWEKNTLQDLSLDPDQDDPRQNVADDLSYTPEHQAISNEQVTQLNELRRHLKAMIKDANQPREPFFVLDCLFGLGLTEYSRTGEEMTMRECCDRLNIHGETQARKIARCQVYLDKGLDLVRQRIRENLPGIVESWQGEINVNTASRRELGQQLNLTENEVEKLVKSRQYTRLDELVNQGIIKAAKLSELKRKGAVAAFVPIDINSATARDITDILGLAKEISQKLVSERPFPTLETLSKKQLLSEQLLQQVIKRGAVLRSKTSDSNRIDLNCCELSEITAAGVPESTAELAVRGRPFLTWAELEEYLTPEPTSWGILRQKFCLGLISG
jgi:DNA uptake protein ComE-like DNA-binding protein